MILFENIELMKTVLINNIYNATTNYSQYVSVEFQPDIMLITQVNYTNVNQGAAGASFMLLMSSNITSDQYLFSINGGGVTSQITATPLTVVSDTYQLMTPFQIFQPVKGNFSFNIVDIKGSPPANAATFNLALSFTIVFIKFKNKK